MAANCSVVEHTFIIVDGGLSDVNPSISTQRIVTCRTLETLPQPKSTAQQTKITRRFHDVLAAVLLLGTCGFCFWSLLSSMR